MKDPLRLFGILSAVTCCSVALLADDGPQTIVAFGDSTTAERGPLKIYVDLLQKELPIAGNSVRIINAGIGGNNTDQARQRFQTDVLKHDPSVVIIQFGINDASVDVWKDPPVASPRVDLAAYRKNLTYFVRQLQSRGIDVILMTPNPMRWTAGAAGSIR